MKHATKTTKTTAKTTAKKNAKTKDDGELLEVVGLIVEGLTASDGDLTAKGRAEVRGLAGDVLREMPDASAREMADEVAKRFDGTTEPRTAVEYIGGGSATDTLAAMRDDLQTIEMALRYQADIKGADEIAWIANSLGWLNLRLHDTIKKMDAERAAVTS